MHIIANLRTASYAVSSNTKRSSNTSRKTELEKQASHTGVVDELLEKLALLLRVSRVQRQITKPPSLYLYNGTGI